MVRQAKTKGGICLTYQWKVDGLYSVDAQTAGEELERICDQHGRLFPEDIVDESRPSSAPLHPCFEWNDPKAAELYRITQAQSLVRCITITVEVKDTPVEVRAFVRAESPGYQPIQKVVEKEYEAEVLLRNALDELHSFERKYRALSQLSPVFDAIEAVES